MQPAYKTVTDFLLQHELRLAVAESLTAGLIQSKMVALEGASDFFSGGLTAYLIDMKVHLLGVDRAEAESTHAVSPRIVKQMAQSICELMQSQVGLATTGYAERDAKLQVDIPYAFIAVYVHHRNKKICRSQKVIGIGLDRTDMLEHVAERAVELLASTIQMEFDE